MIPSLIGFVNSVAASSVERRKEPYIVPPRSPQVDIACDRILDSSGHPLRNGARRADDAFYRLPRDYSA